MFWWLGILKFSTICYFSQKTHYITLLLSVALNTGLKNSQKPPQKNCLGGKLYKIINWNILFWSATLLSNVWVMWYHDKIWENTGGFQVLLLYTVIFPQQQNHFPACWDKVCILWHMHSGSWVTGRIDMRSWNEILILLYMDNAFIKTWGQSSPRAARICMQIKTQIG